MDKVKESYKSLSDSSIINISEVVSVSLFMCVCVCVTARPEVKFHRVTASFNV